VTTATRYENLHMSQTGGTVTLALNRPEKRNAMNPRMMDEILHALDRIEACSCGVMVLTGMGAAFCSGMDLDNLKTLAGRTPAEHRADSERIAQLMRRLYDFPKPTIAAVNGAAIAGGAGLVSVCDFAYSVPEAKFGYTEVRIGFVPAVVSAFLVAQVGERIAKDVLLTGRIFKATEALELGLINGVLEQRDLMPNIERVANSILANSPGSVLSTKKLLSAYASQRLDWELERAVHVNATIRTEPDFVEGISSFLEGRAPDWPSRKSGHAVKPC
jgi:methylglutaconyl-CoA hydratase